MISAFVTVALASAAVAGVSPTALDSCLINLSNAPEYAEKSVAELAADVEGFINQARDSWCADEVSEAGLWKDAHDAARKTLGVPAEGRPARGQQELAESGVRSVLAQRMLALEVLRKHPPKLTAVKLKKLRQIWLLNQLEKPEIEALVEPSLKCIATAASKDSVLANRLVGQYDSASALIGKLGETCGYSAAVSELADSLQSRFPETSRSSAISTADELSGQLLFWAVLSSGQKS